MEQEEMLQRIESLEQALTKLLYFIADHIELEAEADSELSELSKEFFNS